LVPFAEAVSTEACVDGDCNAKAAAVVRPDHGQGWRLIEDDCGVTAIEYALIVGLIVMAFVALITQIGDFISVPLDTVASYL